MLGQQLPDLGGSPSASWVNCDGVTSTQRGFSGVNWVSSPSWFRVRLSSRPRRDLIVVETRTLPRREAPEGRGPVAWVTLRSMSSSLQAVDALHPVVAHHVVNTLQWPGLRPLQATAVEPILGGLDALLLAPTAGGKTEAAMFPLLSRMAGEGWSGTSLLYVCPLRALLEQSVALVLQGYAGWPGRTAAVWHGDTGSSRRARTTRRERPDVLLTTPESLESMLVSTLVDAQRFFADLRAIVVDEVHAFAGDDRGWHLFACRRTTRALSPATRYSVSGAVGDRRQPGRVAAVAAGPFTSIGRARWS